MSKMFDLMPQLEIDRESSSDRIVEPDFAMSDENRDGLSHPEWVGEEAQRLVQQIFLLQTQEPPHVTVFAGIDHGNGCSRICGAVAEALARNSRGSVCLVQANFRSRVLSALFDTKSRYGLTDSLLREEPIRFFTKPMKCENLWLLSSGAIAVDSPNLLTSERMKTRLAELRAEFEFVIIDAPPLTRYADAIALGQMTDGLVLILEADSTRRKAALMATANLRSSKVPILAAVLNKRTFPIPEKIYSRL